MVQYKFGDIVLIKFPFTDSLTFKKRPALIIKDTGDGDVVVCRITSKLYDSGYDVDLPDWNKNGLKLPSVIRIHKIASLEKEMIDVTLGEIDDAIKSKVMHVIGALLKP